MDTIDTVAVAITADTSAFTAGVAEAETSVRGLGTQVSAALAGAQAPARGFSTALSDAFTSVAVKGRDVGDVIASLGQRLSNLALNVALKPLEQGLTGTLNQVLGSGLGALGGAASATSAFADGGVLEAGRVRPFADGGVLEAGRVRAFADGGVVSAPTYFPMSSGTGLMGERGAEAILPLARGADGALGVRTQSGGGTTTVQVNVSTPDPGAFRRSDAYVSGLVARAVARGQRSL